MRFNFTYSPPVKILFWFRKSIKNPKSGIIYCRLVHQGKRVEITTEIEVLKKHWNVDRKKASGEENEWINLHLDELTRAIRRIEKEVTGQGIGKLQTIRDKILQKAEPQKPEIVKNMDWLIANFFQVKFAPGTDLSVATRSNVKRKMAMVERFIKSTNLGELLVVDFKPIHARKLYSWLRESGYEHNTVVKACRVATESFQYAIEEGIIVVNPFVRMKLSEVVGELEFVSMDDLATLENHPFGSSEIGYCVDLFVLMCYTGMNISDLKKLRVSDFYTDRDREWLTYTRQKSAANKSALIANIPIFPKVKEILTKYGGELSFKHGQVVNRNLQQAGQQLGISIHLTTKLARKTCAHILINEMGLSVDSAAAILGNTVRTFMKSYANVRMKRIASELDRLA